LARILNMRPILKAAASGLVLAAAFASAVDAAPIVTRHQIRVDGKTLGYTAEAGEVTLEDPAGKTAGEMFYAAYRTKASSRPRPVMFLWNGGPGSNSTPLHFEAFGPRRVSGGRLVDNDTTLLTDADLVFVDPVGTGFSRAEDPDRAKAFYSTTGDFAAMTQFVARWLSLHDARQAPVFLVGESFGVWRAAAVAQQLEEQGQRVSGIVLISGGAGVGSNALPRNLAIALRTPGRTATALFHRRLDPALGSSRDRAVAAATAWADHVYAPALAHVDTLNEAQRAGILRELARFTGLRPDQIDPRAMAISPHSYLTALIPGKTLDVFDMRRTGEPRLDDDRLIDSYLRHELRFETPLGYAGLAGQPADSSAPKAGWINAHWNYNSGTITPEVIAAARAGEGPPGAEPWALNAIRLDPGLKVLVAAGLYDSLNSCASNEALARRLPAYASGNFTMKCYLGGHMMYRDDVARHRLASDIKALISGAAQH
jgi:carboxypeptidase C (cathepsin A)